MYPSATQTARPAHAGQGTDAAQLLTRRYPAGMPAFEVAAIVTAIAAALDYAHNQALLQRDVKPANIMLTNASQDADQRILLADFGIARQRGLLAGRAGFRKGEISGHA
jgi:serine/threonine protein kinase, bacterial